MVCCVQAEDALDPRCYATVGIEPRTRALLTAVPVRRRAAARGPLEPPAAAVLGRHAAGRRRSRGRASTPSCGSGPSRTRQWFQGRLALLCDSDPESIAALSPDEQRALLERNLARAARTPASSRPRPTGSPTSPISRAHGRASSCRADLPEAPPARRVPPPPDVARGAPPPPAVRARRGRDGARRAVRAARAGRARCAVDIETDCGPLGAPADWSPADGAVRLLQVAARVGGEIGLRRRRLLPRRAAPAAAAARRRPRDHRPQRALRAGLADVPVRARPPGAPSSTRAARSASSSATGRSRIRPTSAATPRSRPSPGACSARPRATSAPDWWGAEPLPPEQLDYAAYDAVALLELRERALALAEAFGCTAQVLAASRTACVEAFRRLPAAAPARLERRACELIDAAADDAGARPRRRRDPPPAAAGLAARGAARALRGPPRALAA